MSASVIKKSPDNRLRNKRERWMKSCSLILGVTKDKMRSHWGEFCSVTPIHGVRYLSEPKRPLVEKIWWLFVVLLSMAFAGINAWQQYKKLINSPITEIPEGNCGNLSMIPFPAVTICDNRKSYFLAQVPGEDDSTRPFREAKLLICGDPHPLSEETDMEKLLEMSPPLDQSCDLCNAFSKKTWTNCTAMFKRIVTDVGVCQTFNMFSPSEIFTEGTEIEYEEHNKSSDWMPEESAYTEKTLPVNKNGQGFSSPYPRRAENQLTVTLFNQLPSGAFEALFCDSSDPLGFKIILHSPHEVPMVGHRRDIRSLTEFNETSIGQYFLLPMERKVF
ncbi:unnamed protein product [Nezara viridula]|uniref:Uncharacterized protein n=1 Tax=Nezara viridula TaxID=85310 RepID=A0A9P0HF38_NEZVI|nr:unnamed protein product [Nezara viridula]